MSSFLSYNPTCSCTNIDPNTLDSNIAGPGVLVGFIVTGTFTFLASNTVLYLRYLSSTTHPARQPRLLRRLTPHSVTNPATFWISILSGFVLQLSDQQLMVGLLLLVSAYVKYWQQSVLYGSNNLWTASDIVCFSSFTHAATLLSLRPYFRQHRRLATARVLIMYVIYILWLVVAVQILKPDKPGGKRNKDPWRIGVFWHAATYIETFGVMWIYLISYLPIFLSDDAATVRGVIAEGAEGDGEEVVQEWVRAHRMRKSSASVYRTTWKKFNLYAIIRRYMTRFAVRFCDRFVNTKSRWRRGLLWAAAELFFPCYTAEIILGVLWAFSLGALILSLYEGRLASSWDFGQLLSAFMILLPFQSLVSVLAEATGPEKHPQGDHPPDDEDSLSLRCESLERKENVVIAMKSATFQCDPSHKGRRLGRSNT